MKINKLFAILGLAVFSSAVAQADVRLQGGGATFPAPIYTKWFSEYNKLHSDVRINYQPIGSGGGVRQVRQVGPAERVVQAERADRRARDEHAVTRDLVPRSGGRPDDDAVQHGFGAEDFATDAETEHGAQPHYSVSLLTTASRLDSGTHVNVARATIAVPSTPPSTRATSCVGANAAARTKSE